MPSLKKKPKFSVFCKKSKINIKDQKYQYNKSDPQAFKRRLYSFVLRLLGFISLLPKNQITKVLGDQLIRSGTSILGNYIEAGASSSRKDYINFFHHSLKSANESKVWLALLRDTGNGDREEVAWLLHELQEIADIIASSLITLKGKKRI